MSEAVNCWLLPGFVGAPERRALRELATTATAEARYIPDRVRQTVLAGIDAPELLTRIQASAEQWLGCPLQRGAVQWTRHERGSYRLTRDDDRPSAVGGHPIDALLDFSEHSSDEGQVYFAGADRQLVVPQRAGLLALVERTPDLWRHERYLTIRSAGRTIYRLRVLLQRLGTD